jgi:tripartite-type tricarboxylate transporter receptor subunit TctC
VVTSGNGTQQHLGLEQLKLAAGINVVHVPYKGAGPAANDLVIGQVDVGILNISSMLAYIKDGRLTGLAVTEGKRSTYAPDLPSIAETVPGFNSVEWFAFIAPAGVPDDVIDKIQQAIIKAARTDAYAEKVKQMGVDLVLNTPAELRAQMEKEYKGFAELVEKANIKFD